MRGSVRQSHQQQQQPTAVQELRPLFFTLLVLVVACGAWIVHMQHVISIRATSLQTRVVAHDAVPVVSKRLDEGGAVGDGAVADNMDDETPAPPTRHHHHRKIPHKHGHEKDGEGKGEKKQEPTHAPTHHVAQHHHHHTTKPPDGHAHHQHKDPATAPHVPTTPAPHHRHRPGRRRAADSAHEGEKGDAAIAALGGKVAYAVVVSNEEFVDGALTLAWSFRNHSKLFRSGKAQLVLVTPKGKLSADSLARLRAVGWADQRLVEDLTKEAGQSTWAGTFNKLYLFGLTEYKRVAYFDVDMLMLRSPDDIFASKLPDETYVGALGNSHHKHKPYFQTGMMLIIPTVDAFETMMHDFRTRKENRGVNGRDGVIVRRYYKERYVNIDDRLSSHLGVEESLDNVIGFHFRGSWKPWFDKALPPAADPRKGPNAVEEREIGQAYFLWWSTYYDLHRTVLATMPLSVDAPKGFNASQSVWLMRHTARSYTQSLPSLPAAGAGTSIGGGANVEAASSRLATDNTTSRWADASIETSLTDENCDLVCGLRQAVCHEDTLLDTRLNNCDLLKERFHCVECSAFTPHRSYPALDMKTQRCHANPLADPGRMPRCAELSGDRRRLCPCVPLGALLPFSARKGTTSGPIAAAGSAPVVACDGTSRAGWSDDAKCRDYLRQVANIDKAMLAPASSVVGVTAKLFLTFRDGVTRGVMKLPQKGFPHEPQSEVAAYHVDRLLGTNLVPPTVTVWVKVAWLSKLLAAPTPGIPHAYSAQLEAQRGGALELVVDYCRGRTDVFRGTGAENEEIAVSVQLWVQDVHRLADSTLSLPADYNTWFGGDTTSADYGDDAAVAAIALPQLSDLLVFDYIIGNDDRVPTRNTFVVGGCKTYCRKRAGSDSALVPLEPTPQPRPASVVAIDQGHAFYDAREYTDLISSAIRLDAPSKFCRLRATLFSKLKNFSAAVIDAKSERDDDSGSGSDRRWTLTKALQAALEVLPDGTGESVTKALTPRAFSMMQRRLDDAVRFLTKCTARRGPDVLWP